MLQTKLGDPCTDLLNCFHHCEEAVSCPSSVSLLAVQAMYLVVLYWGKETVKVFHLTQYVSVLPVKTFHKHLNSIPENWGVGWRRE